MKTLKYIVSVWIVIMLCSCSINTVETIKTETDTVSTYNTEVTTSHMVSQSFTTTFKCETTTNSMTTIPTTTQNKVVDPLQEAIYINDFFYYNKDEKIVYLIKNGENIDSIKSERNIVSDNFFFSALETEDNIPLAFDIPCSALIDGNLYTEFEGKISRVKFFIDKKEMDIKNSYFNHNLQYVSQTSPISFVTYFKNLWDDGYYGKAEFTYNRKTNSFEGVLTQNSDKAAEQLSEDIYNDAEQLLNRIVFGLLKMECDTETGETDSSKLINIDGYLDIYRYSKITEEGFRTKEEFLTTLQTIFTEDCANTIYYKLTDSTENNIPCVVEIDGELYLFYAEGAHGGDYEIYYDVVNSSDNSIETKVVWMDYGGSPYKNRILVPNMILTKTENGWRISQNPLQWWLS